MERSFPESFASLEPLVDWALDTETKRLEKRLGATMPQIQAFYDAVLPCMSDILAYLDQFSFDALPEDARKLLELTLSLAQVAPAVEMFHQPAVVCGFDARSFLPTHEATSRRPQMSIALQSFK